MFSKLGYLLIIFTFILLNFGCGSFADKKQKPQKEVDEFDSSDLLRFKVKEESFRKDSLSLIFKNIFFEEVGLSEFDLKINVDYKRENINYHQKYYLVIAIYPRDEDIQLLDDERRRYKFVSYSMKIRTNQMNDLVLARKIKTKLKFARAITISLFEYKTKLKSKEIVLQNVKF